MAIDEVTMQNSVIIRVIDPSIRRRKLCKLTGDIPISSFIDVISYADLEANPRAAKQGAVTDEIEESLQLEPEIFEFLTKGVLLAARKVEELERNRFRLTFEDPALEGILDGGHNTLAIARFVLRKVLAELLDEQQADAALKKIKRWDDLKTAWTEYKDEIAQLKDLFKDVLIPVEVIYPSDEEDAETEFQDRILKINAARNNNVQLTEETKANKRGHYDEIRANIDPVLSDQVEWKTNDGGRVKVRDLVALSLIPLSKLDFEASRTVAANPSVIFSGKAQCVNLYNALLESNGVTEPVKGDIVQVVHAGVKSALTVMRDMPELFDLAYEQLPAAYNETSPGFGRIRGVKLHDPVKYKDNKQKYLRTPAKTHFYQRDVEFAYGEGFAYPVVYGLSAILEVDGDTVKWATEPRAFLKQHLPGLMKAYQSLISGQTYDPAKVGKANGSYALAYEMFKSAYRDEVWAKQAATQAA